MSFRTNMAIKKKGVNKKKRIIDWNKFEYCHNDDNVIIVKEQHKHYNQNTLKWQTTRTPTQLGM